MFVSVFPKCRRSLAKAQLLLWTVQGALQLFKPPLSDVGLSVCPGLSSSWSTGALAKLSAHADTMLKPSSLLLYASLNQHPVPGGSRVPQCNQSLHGPHRPVLLSSLQQTPDLQAWLPILAPKHPKQWSRSISLMCGHYKVITGNLPASPCCFRDTGESRWLTSLQGAAEGFAWTAAFLLESSRW